MLILSKVRAMRFNYDIHLPVQPVKYDWKSTVAYQPVLGDSKIRAKLIINVEGGEYITGTFEFVGLFKSLNKMTDEQALTELVNDEFAFKALFDASLKRIKQAFSLDILGPTSPVIKEVSKPDKILEPQHAK